MMCPRRWSSRNCASVKNPGVPMRSVVMKKWPRQPRRFQQVRDGVMEAHAAIVEGEQHGAPLEHAHGAHRRRGRGDGIQVAFEILAAQLIDVGAFAGETARLEIAVLHNVVVHDGKRLHGVSSY